jgi:hypothetical protein
VTVESYIATVNKYFALTQKQAQAAAAQLGKSNKHVVRLENRLKLIKHEI